MDDTSSDTDLSSSPESFQSCPDDMDQTSTAPVIVAAPNPVELLALGHPVGGFTDSTRKPAGGATGGTFSAVWGLVSGSASPPGKYREGTQYSVGGLKKDTASPGEGWASDSLSPIGRLGVSTISPVGGLRQSAPSLVRRLREDSPSPVSGGRGDIPSASSGLRESPLRMRERTPSPNLEWKESPFRMRERTPSPDLKWKESPFRMRERTPSPDLERKESPFRMREHTPSLDPGLRESPFRMRECTPSPDLKWKESPFRMRERTPSPDLERKESPFRMREHTPSLDPGLRESPFRMRECTPSPDLEWKESPFRKREHTPSLDPGLRESPFRMRERTPSPDSGWREDSQGLREHTPSPVVGTPVAPVGEASQEVQEKEKTLGVATKRLGVVRDKLKYFLKETAARGRSVQQKLDKVESNKTEVEKALNDHVKYLHSLVDYYHHEQQELLKQHHKGFLKQLLVTKTEELNFEARLTDMQKKVDDVFHRIDKERDAKAANSQHIATLCDEYHRCVSSRPGRKDHSQIYLVEIPQVTVDDMQALVGHYVFTDGSDNTKASQSCPTPHWPGYEDLPADQAASAERGSASSSSSQKSAASLRTGNPAKSVPPKASTGSVHTKDYSLPKTSSGDATQGHKTTGNPPTSSLRFSKERRMKEKLAKASSSNVSSSEESCTQPSEPSAQPRAISASLDKKQKQSEMMASSSSIASSASVSSKKRARSRRSQKKAKAKQETVEPAKPVMITLLHEKGQPKKIDGRLKEARGFAARPDGELWVVYGSRDPHLDRISEAGDILESCRIGGNAMQAASFSQESVLLCLHSPCCQLKLMDAQRESQEMIKLPLIPSGLGVGSTGIAVCGYKAVYWVPLDGGANEWIVEDKKSSLKNACSCDVIFMQGKEIVCVADSEGHKVWFFEKLDSGKFTPLPLFTYASHSKQGKTVPFSPVCLSWLAGSSFLAVLDGASHSVLMVDMERNEVVSVIAGKELCNGVPSLICFALTNTGEDPKLWVASDSKKIYLVSLAFLY